MIRRATPQRVREQLDSLIDDIVDVLDRHHEVLIRVDSGGSFYVDRSSADGVT